MVVVENVFHVKHVVDGEHRVVGTKVVSTPMFEYVTETYRHPDEGVVVRRIIIDRSLA